MSDAQPARPAVRVQARFTLRGEHRDRLAEQAAELLGALHELASAPCRDLEVGIEWTAPRS